MVKVSGDDGATWTELDRYAGERPGGWSGGNGVTVTRSGDVLASAVSFDPTTPENSAERFSSVVRRVTTPGF